ncbi:MAG: TolC family protein [Vulcanimicrobiaceae bacterium]
MPRYPRIRLIGPATVTAALALAFAAIGPVAAAPSQPRPVVGATIPPPPAAPVLPAVPTVARGYRAPRVLQPAAGIVGVTQRPFVGISLPDAIGMALSQNGQLAVAQANRRIAGYQIIAAKGAFNVRFQVVPSFLHSQRPPTSSFFAGPNFGAISQNTQKVSGGLQGILPNGQQYSVNLSEAKIDDNTIINTFDPYYPTNLSASFVQPILRGAGMSLAKQGLELARIGADRSTAQTLTAVSTTIAQVEDAYWDLVSGWRNVAIQEDALKQAIAQQQSNIRLAKHGVAAPISAVESSTQVHIFQENVYSALQSVAALQNSFKALLVTDPSAAIWNANLVPTSPVLSLPHVPSLQRLVMEALKNRPEMREVIDARKAADLKLAYARNQLKPRLDLALSYQSNGFAGALTNPNNDPLVVSSAQQTLAIDQLIAAVNARLLPPNQQIPSLPLGNGPLPPPYLIGNLNQSLSNLFNGRYPTYGAALTFAIPLGNQTRKAEFEQAVEGERVAQIQEATTIQSIAIQARNALQDYRTALARLAAASQAGETSAQVLASEQRRFRNGAATTYFVLQRQVQLEQNRGLELQAQTDLNKAVVELERVSGNILTSNHVRLEDVGAGVHK